MEFPIEVGMSRGGLCTLDLLFLMLWVYFTEKVWYCVVYFVTEGLFLWFIFVNAK